MQPNISETIISRPIIRTSRRYSNGLKGGNNGIFEITINPEATRNQRLLIFGDSFFRLSLGMLSYFYKEIIFCRTPYLYPEIVSSCSPDIVFTGNAERYLSNVVSDELRKDFFNTPIQLGLNLSIDNEFKKVIKDMFDLSKIKFPVCYNE